MNPRTFPKSLDSRTSCLRLSVPENLDLALEGLIRKVLRDQPPADRIHAFAAEYFEALLRIRDKAGAEYTATQLCPFHNDDEAREMIVLAGTFPKQVAGGVRGKGAAPLKAATKREPEKGVKRPKETLKERKAETEKQATPDLIKKLPVLGQNQGANGEKATEAGPELERTESAKEGGEDEEYSTSDPIKELVEKELLRGGKWEEEVGEGPEGGSPGARARGGQHEEAEGGASLAGDAEEEKGADGGGDFGGTDVVGGVTRAKEDGRREKMGPEPPETDEKGGEAREVAKEEEDKSGEGAKPGAEEGRQRKKEKKSVDESGKLRAEEDSRNENSGGVEPPVPPLPPSPNSAEKRAQEVVDEVSGSCRAETEVSPEVEGGKEAQSAGSSKGSSPEEKGIAEVGGAQGAAEDKSERDAQRSIASPMKTDEESPESSSPVTNSSEAKAVENDDAWAAVTEKSEKSDRKEASERERESTARSEGGEGEGEEARTETESSAEGGKGAEEMKEGGASFEEEGLDQTKDVESKQGREIRDTEADEADKADVKSAEEGKGSSGSGAEAEDGAGQPRRGAEDSRGEAGEEKRGELSVKLDPDQKVEGSEILRQEQLPHCHPTKSNKETESERGDEAGKAVGEEKLSEEEMKAKDWSLAERRESLCDRTSGEELPLQKVENVQCAAGTPREESADVHGRQTPPAGSSSTTEEPKREEQGDAEREVSRGRSSPTEPGGTPEIGIRDTESGEPQEFKSEEAPTEENEAASLADEEMCTVVDVDHLKRGERIQEEPKPAKSPPETAPEGISGAEPEGPPSPSTQGKAGPEDLPLATAIREPATPEADKEKESSAEKRGAGTWEDFELSTEGKQVIIVEEAETTKENPERSSPPGEIQIKTIQTHYYDTLRVPEAVTREYRVHELAIDGLPGPASPPPSPPDEEGSGRLTDPAAFPPTPTTSPASDGGVPTLGGPAEPQPRVRAPHHPSRATPDALLALDGSPRDAQPSDSDDLPHPTTPTSDSASNLSELSLQAASETFLSNEKRFSSLEKEGIRFATPATEELGKGDPEGRHVERGRETDDGGDETTLPSAATPRTPPRTPADGASAEGAEDDEGGGGRPEGPSGGSPPARNSPTDAAEPLPRGEREGAPDAPRPPSEAEPEDAEEPLHSKTQGRNVLERCPEEVQAGSGADGPSTHRTPTGEASGADAARRALASARGLSSGRSLDLGKRNPLLRTRSLSSHRHGVADFEVWTTIEKELEEAATKIQSKFRGYNTRKKLRRELAVQISTEESSKRSSPVEPDHPDNRSRATGEFHDGIVLPDHPR